MDRMELRECPFCGDAVTQEVKITETTGANRFMHTAKIEHFCGSEFGRPDVGALELFCGEMENQALLDSCAEAQRKRWNTRSAKGNAQVDEVKLLYIIEDALGLGITEKTGPIAFSVLQAIRPYLRSTPDKAALLEVKEALQGAILGEDTGGFREFDAGMNAAYRVVIAQIDKLLGK